MKPYDSVYYDSPCYFNIVAIFQLYLIGYTSTYCDAIQKIIMGHLSTFRFVLMVVILSISVSAIEKTLDNQER